ncbi:SMI1/KNR4 family protein [Kitasatospora cinereorecta]|uniref:SMI1/KNR4 family protein n=1 Tax=Kitasatospora cinereorecta TaxID=285560 RepID=A0ABW0VBU6_9ACTN
MTALDTLRKRLGEPEHSWGRPTPELWHASEAHLGMGLPSDFKAFLDLYGPGAVDGYLHLDRPLDGSPEEAERLWDRGWHRDWHRNPELYPWPFHPDQGGLINWGSDEHSNSYFFLPLEPDPDDWRIVIAGEEGEWFETGGGFTDFVLRCFDRLDRPPFLDPVWPDRRDARFHPRPAPTCGSIERQFG